ncbi:MAG: hypothetical protein K0M40_06915 [Prolixibacteraceae bacterium]|nr:hypothetical protein [Prolixibacteraceae bacterium]
MTGSLHTIRKQVVQFQYNGNADGFALQKEVSDWCNFTLIPEIEQQLDLLELGDNFVTIDKLEIEATANKNDWQQKIRDELISSLKQKLSNYKPSLKEAGKVKSISKSGKLDELMLFYFEFGYLPWWGKAMITDDFETVLREWITEEISSLRAKSISERLKQQISRSQIERILNQVPKELFFQLLKNIYKQEIEIISHTESLLKEVIVSNTSATQKKAIKETVYRFLLTMMIENEGIINTDVLIQFVYKEVKQTKTTLKLLKPSSERIGKTANPVEIAWLQFLLKEIKSQKSGRENQDPSVNKNKAITGQNQEEKENRLQYNKLIDKLTDPAKKSRDNLVAELQEGIYIDNAGAVIFAAFLPALFKQLALVRDGVIQNPDLAALIIQYCVTGSAKIAEYELVLPKILCGLAIEFPVNTNIRIDAGQMKEVDEMLLSLIEYWSVLKNTSIDGLRESFFKRSGKLGMVNNEWVLQVEQKPFDMLLQQLPWSISMIKLPWMTNLLKTEWV